jgi:hypothetical protein
MRAQERRIERRRLDGEMRPFRQAAMKPHSTQDLLRAVRQVLRIPVKEIAGKMDVDRSVLYGLEVSERRKTITLKSLSRVARAMGCRVVYGVVPEGGLTLEELAEERRILERNSEAASERGSDPESGSGEPGAGNRE